jgi:hypothetical protein
MTILHHVAQAAAAILLVELLVMLLIFAALSGGTAFGLHWTRGKTAEGFEKVNERVPTVRRYVHRGNELVRKPFIEADRLSALARVRALQLRDRIQSILSPVPTPGPATPDAYPPEGLTVEMAVIPRETVEVTSVAETEPLPVPPPERPYSTTEAPESGSESTTPSS